MTAADLLKVQIEDSGFQLSQVYTNMAEATMDFRPTRGAMTPREQAAHLCECYQAFLTESQGGKHQWGAYEVGNRETQALMSKLWQLRGQAAEVACSGKDNQATSASAYIVAHDYYHVGQLCLIRMAAEPDWNPYSIYRFNEV